jgi:hypothetical protein
MAYVPNNPPALTAPRSATIDEAGELVRSGYMEGRFTCQ